MSINKVNFHRQMYDNISMNTIKQVIEICDKRLKELGITRAELLRRANQSPTLFTMALKRNYYFGIESFVSISDALGIPLTDLLVLEEHTVPEDIKAMEDMLLKIPEEDRKMIALNIRNYYEKALKEHRE